MEQLINFIIRPPRAEYDPQNDLLDEEFMLRGKWYQRKDVEIVNSRGDVLQCSHYMPIVRPEGKALPCVIYCHGNSGCRTDASEAAIILLPSNITVFTLDFSGSGLSGGEHVTLGWNEKDDLRAVVDHLRADGNISLIGLWGRSMGAVTSLMYGVEDPSIAGMVLDSPFSDLVDLMMELVDTYKVRLPKFTVKFAIQYMRRAILKKAKFDISELNTIKGDKNIIKFDGDHNSPRPQFYFDSINIFFHNVLQPPENEVGEMVIDTTQNYFGKGSWSILNDIGYSDSFSTASVDPAPSSTEDAINQLRSKRPMSRMEVPSDMSCQDNHQSEAQEEGSGTKPVPSSSKMISFEFANGHPSGPHVSSSADDDDDYVEYPLDNLADFPSNVEEEERMLMEAVLESLKDLDTRKPCLPAEPSRTETDPNKPSQREKPDESTITDHRVSNGPNLASELTSPDTSESSMEPSSETAPSVVESGNIGVSANSETSPDIKSSSNSDTSDRTKATVTVERNPPSNMIEGLMRRWDFNFFRNNR